MLYRDLFSVNMYHAYFLDEGEQKFFDLDGNAQELSPEDKEKAEQQYISSDFLTIIPTKKTIENLKNHRYLLSNHNKGIRVSAEVLEVTADNNGSEVKRYSPIITPSEDLVLTFYIKVHDAYFNNYSDIIDKRQNQLYYLSNIGTSSTNIFQSILRAQKWSSFLLSEKETRKLVWQLEIENQLKSKIPNLISISNIKEDELDIVETKIDTNTALNSDEEKVVNKINSYVQSFKNKSLIGVLQLKIKTGNNANLLELIQTKNKETKNFDIPKQCLLTTAPSFNVYIENRKTFWQYIDKNKSVTMTTKKEKPLTKNGRIEIKKQDVMPLPSNNYHFPNATPRNLKEENQNYYSQIFI